MSNLTTVGVTSGVPSSGTGTVSTIDNMFTAAGTPSSNVQTVQFSTTLNSTANPVVISLSSAAVVSPSSVWTVAVSSITGGTVTLSSAVSVTQLSATTVASVYSAASNNSTLLSSASATIRSVSLFNGGSSTVFLKFYNLSSAPTAGTSSILWIVGVAPGTPFNAAPLSLTSSVGLGYTVTGTLTSTSTTALAAGDLVGIIGYST